MQPMARPARAMTEASTSTSQQKGMVANTREMVSDEAKSAHNDWARLWSRRGRSVEGPRALGTVPPPSGGRGEEAGEEALSLTGCGFWARCSRSRSLRGQSPSRAGCEDPREYVTGTQWALIKWNSYYFILFTYSRLEGICFEYFKGTVPPA